jgi:hypothetical protein
MIDPYAYPYGCPYLSHLLKVEKLTGSQILARVLEMMDWLSTNKCSHEWSTNEDMDTVGRNCVGYPLSSNPANHISFSRHIYFTHEQDLLAFRLRWGINS